MSKSDEVNESTSERKESHAFKCRVKTLLLEINDCLITSIVEDITYKESWVWWNDRTTDEIRERCAGPQDDEGTNESEKDGFHVGSDP